ncbi:MAG: uroporphyrinogen-III synthase [Chloroflexi bacterium]|nr:uroporphyrinogen-III synthase [Chloroflexota bacterium]
MAGLQGARIGLLEGRMTSELAGLVRRHGGEPHCVPAVREEPLDCSDQVAALIDRIVQGGYPYFVFQTGVGANALFREAGELGRLPELLAALAGMTTVCRGPKPTAALRKQGIRVDLVVATPYTTAELLDTMAPLDLDGAGVALTHYGERNVALAEALQRRGARLEELCLYVWRLPDDLTALKALVGELIGGELDAVAFTSQIQVRHLFAIAADLGLAAPLAEAMQHRMLTAAVGPTCAAALLEVGVRAHVAPENPKMGPLVLALAEALEARSGALSAHAKASGTS